MADVFTKEKRNDVMRQVKSSNTKPEIIVRKKLFHHGFRYRLNDKKLPGKPDIVLKKFNTVIFIHGCFWHGHNGCKNFRMPKSNLQYWKPKISNNMQKDKRDLLQLRKLGWKVIIIWECDLKLKQRDQTLNKLLSRLK